MQCDSEEEEAEKPNLEKKEEILQPSPRGEPIKQCVFYQLHFIRYIL